VKVEDGPMLTGYRVSVTESGEEFSCALRVGRDIGGVSADIEEAASEGGEAAARRKRGDQRKGLVKGNREEIWPRHVLCEGWALSVDFNGSSSSVLAGVRSHLISSEKHRSGRYKRCCVGFFRLWNKCAKLYLSQQRLIPTDVT